MHLHHLRNKILRQVLCRMGRQSDPLPVLRVHHPVNTHRRRRHRASMRLRPLMRVLAPLARHPLDLLSQLVDPLVLRPQLPQLPPRPHRRRLPARLHER